MLIKATRQITHISENDKINSENYFEALSYINNLFTFISRIKPIISTKLFTFVPTFKGRHTCEKFGLSLVDDAESEMRVFIIESELFLEDTNETRERIKEKFKDICSSIIFDGKTVEFIFNEE